MASTWKTTRGFNQWVEDDIPEMSDFNEDNYLINAVLTETQNKHSRNSSELAAVQKNLQGGKAINALHAERVGMAANGMYSRSFSILPEQWTNSIEFITRPYEVKIPIPDLVETDSIFLLFDINSIMPARECGIMNGMGHTGKGAACIYAVKKPENPLYGSYIIVRQGFVEKGQISPRISWRILQEKKYLWRNLQSEGVTWKRLKNA